MKLNIKKQMPEVFGLSVGAIGSGYVTKLLPIGNEKIKAAAPLLLGIFLSQQKGIIGHAGKGMIAAGAANLAKSFGIGAVGPNVLIGEIDEFTVNGIEDGSSVTLGNSESEF